ncbi:pyruvate kinase PKM [Octopus sinensis]|uniref:Pyruvate kinase n=1 Tax=Octopus sinensis TaxID=2607531 RepID=A0A6P7T5B6_9MOLL|nr:pyruvate kinase PKM [Octopus sinensis]XP_036365390.1 pyruvate kinase PKM [Octopus sinensis]
MVDAITQSKGFSEEKEYSFLEHLCSLDIDTPQVKMPHMTSIIATVGPACDDIEVLKDMIKAGVNIFRLVMAYGDRYSYHSRFITNIRQVSNELLTNHSPVGIAIDIAGPEVRLGKLKPELGREIFFKHRSVVRISYDSENINNMDDSFLYIDQQKLIDYAKVDSIIVIEDGPLSLMVVDKELQLQKSTLICEVIEEGLLGNRQTCHMKGMPDMYELSDNDKNDLQFALDEKVDMVFMSLVSDRKVVELARDFLRERGKSIKIISKIENYKGVKNINDIISVSDGIIISRGNLGISIKPEKLFKAQKMITGLANIAGKSVTCASQMLESMTIHPRPTRAEAGDVANSVLDGIDCVMLSSETAKGKYVIQSIKTLVQICREAEGAMFAYQFMKDLSTISDFRLSKEEATALAAVKGAISCEAKAIVVVTSSGKSAALISRYRPRCIVIAVTRSPITARQLHLYRGVLPVIDQSPVTGFWEKDYNLGIKKAFENAVERGFLKVKDRVMLVRGWTEGSGSTDTMCVATVPGENDPLPMTY